MTNEEQERLSDLIGKLLQMSAEDYATYVTAGLVEICKKAAELVVLDPVCAYALLTALAINTRLVADRIDLDIIQNMPLAGISISELKSEAASRAETMTIDIWAKVLA